MLSAGIEMMWSIPKAHYLYYREEIVSKVNLLSED